jgi:NMD protein affecting ribosome stability and mRNA decay
MKECPKCGAIYYGHRWIPEPDKELLRKYAKSEQDKELCPGCLRIEKQQVEGVVTLKGAFMDSHRDEVENLVDRVANNGRHQNIAARIFEIKREEEGLVIETTDEHLAERIGKEVEKAFKGDLNIKWQKKDRFVRVSWQRE